MSRATLNKKHTTLAAALALACALALVLGGCAAPDLAESTSTEQQAAASISGTVTGDLQFGKAITSLDKEDLDAVGIELGDSVDLSFSNGYSLTDVAYLSGYYLKKGSTLVVAYQGSGAVMISKSSGDFWEPSGLADGDTVEISLNTKGKYLTTETTLSQKYSTDAADYASEEAFANFRTLTGGSIKKDFLYRGASPVNDIYNRASTADDLMEQAGIEFELDLADSAEEFVAFEQEEGFDSPCAASLYAAGCTTTLDMGVDYDDEDYKASLGEGLRQMVANGGKTYIHCTEGKDRTGFVCCLLEALAGATPDEMRADYMQTYENYYGINATDTPEAYELVVANYFEPFLEELSGTTGDALESADYVAGAKAYLAECGLSDAEIEQLQAFICE
jgi:hypothetical protein